jgi:cytochrome c nitrite reductase small subunit
MGPGAGGSMAAAIVITLLGLLAGAGIYTFLYARGHSYLSDDPASCANCHVMREHLDAWAKSSHRAVATCNDCHTPHTSWLAKYAAKAENGFWHSLAFTTQRFPEPIRITKRNARITEDSCLHCHGGLIHGASPVVAGMPAEDRSCARCHGSVGHATR